ncbi:PocR ligand-binding domain-containing protein [Desulfovibrio sp. JC022]|uniref:PocR ligand-binding domain-containing protein n=1 Tax=Desulfovibrio sp. JC022 TaxID=2593642 RepID=UPI0013D35E45|nr:PocR ligand-binding domain-containing protein [Desulfovibrio sp. JC022]NDV23482.1 PAS domain S-box protein [Desulfovibrio sp. JC022]
MKISLLDDCSSKAIKEKLSGLLLKDLVELDELQNMLDASYTATGMPSGIIDAFTGEVYAGAGWQKICVNFHRVHPETCAKCVANDTAITDKIKTGHHHGYKCSNGIWDIGVPIMCMEQHIATFFLGQFFYEDEEPDRHFFINQAEQYGFGQKEYLAALDEVPRFDRERVEQILKHNIALSAFLSDSASKSMRNFYEIEQRREAEAEIKSLRNYLANIIDSMPSILIGVDPDGQITQWNKEAESVSGIGQDKAIGTQLQDSMPTLGSEMDRIRTAITTRRKQAYINRPNPEDNKTACEDITIYPLIANGVRGAVIRIDDVTDRVNLERMMLQSEKMMSVGGLAAGMAHEINNPLSGIMGHATNIRKRIYHDINKNISTAEDCDLSLENMRNYLNERGIPRMLDGISEAGERAATIVRNMLAFSRKSEQNFTPQNLPQLLDRTIELASSDYDLKKEFDFKQIEIEREYDENLPTVLCEGNEIQQVFLNILRNGAEAMAEMQKASRFTCKVYKEENRAVVEIADNGPGMPEDVRKRIFEPFFTTKEVGKGTGLGLSVSYFIVSDQHNGFMDVKSIPGEWTKFIIKLPFK